MYKSSHYTAALGIHDKMTHLHIAFEKRLSAEARFVLVSTQNMTSPDIYYQMLLHPGSGIQTLNSRYGIARRNAQSILLSLSEVCCKQRILAPTQRYPSLP